MFRPVRTYQGSSRNVRKKGQPTPQASSPPHSTTISTARPFVLGQLPLSIQPQFVATGNSILPPIYSSASQNSIPNTTTLGTNVDSPSSRTAKSRSQSPHLIRPLPQQYSDSNQIQIPTSSTGRSRSNSPPTVQERVRADIEYSQFQSRLNRESQNVLQRRTASLQTLNQKAIPLDLRPDGREIFQRHLGLANGNPTTALPSAYTVESFQPSLANNNGILNLNPNLNPNSNPTITSTQPTGSRSLSPVRSSGQPVIIKEESSINYRENEQNLILFSYDRNWLENTTENRYDFTVNFDTASLKDGFQYSASVEKRFRNIVRIELIKAIIASESLENVVLQLGPNTDISDALAFTDTTYQINPLSFPYINISLQEFDGNNYGTDANLNKTFATLQYDAQWHTDILHQNLPDTQVNTLKQTTTRGFLAMIPKYMKCQRVFYPTPLATLTKMSIRMSRPNGQLLSSLPDQLNLQSIYANTEPLFGIDASRFGNQNPATPVSGRTVTYLFLQTPYFPRSCFSQGDRIQIRGALYDRAVLNSYLFNGDGLRNLEKWINRDEGHIIVGIGSNGPNGTGQYQDGPNKIGYANFIIIQSKAVNQDGAIYYESVGNANDIAGANSHFCESPRKLINMSRQTTVIFRIITRDMDSMSNIRPDNTF